eukprot:TRINITY_DN737_c0_g1::TRINITY_DN737_c0_g1_i1::g.18415::m.18415 TRINITY_DN737_c0_g1::TRINITY_DN737_c0_g1_i1::g.18415  ORF type:complete len:329 (-),score=28.15,Frag1/PF10277.4/1e+04,Frag1/PF10277.4/1.2e-09,Orbi_NS3/PF01616.11/3.4,Orbi_NS3/PF01616.11/1.8e+02,DUF4131/PF13567.1/10,DUF4131/PF13567.1/8.4e+02,DUF4131/PF13567.1/2e+02,DUF1230/PF06799.6/3.7e+03,DUF1230/PF06799.6/1,Cytochrom_B_N/PF00033.14/9.5e+02,Cytochrom_B_N/PF00033.14/6.9,DUF2627/PF11118.3/2e+03,DUF2627/PF11118.3/3.6e+03,DUF2627/PF11118
MNSKISEYYTPYIHYLPVASVLLLGFAAVINFILTRTGYIDCTEDVEPDCDSYPHKWPESWDNHEFPECDCVKQGKKFSYVSETSTSGETYPIFVVCLCTGATLWILFMYFLYHIVQQRIRHVEKDISRGLAEQSPAQQTIADHVPEMHISFPEDCFDRVCCSGECCCCCSGNTKQKLKQLDSLCMWLCVSGVIGSVGEIVLSVVSLRMRRSVHGAAAVVFYIAIAVHMFLFVILTRRITSVSTSIESRAQRLAHLVRLGTVICMCLLGVALVIGFYIIREVQYETAYARYFGPVLQYLFGCCFVVYGLTFGHDLPHWLKHIYSPISH